MYHVIAAPASLEEHPQAETYWGNVNPVGPRSCYDESKRFAEAITMAYHRKYGLRTNIARIFNTYGPRMKLNDGRVVPAFLDRALRGQPITVFGDGSQTRSFCYASDLVDGLCRLMKSEERYPVPRKPHRDDHPEFADPQQRKPDIGKARAVLGWEPRVSLEGGMLQTVDYFRSLHATVG
jgi:dTDP-glucose 4,6-dehydratase